MNTVLKPAGFLIAFVIMLLCTPLPAHDVHLAVFNLSQEEEALQLIVTFDKQDLLNNTLHTTAEDPQLLAKIDAYLQEHMQLTINAQACQFAFSTITEEPLVYQVSGSSQPFGESPKEIHLQNTCMLAEVPRHENIIHFVMHGKTRSFRMSAARQEISLNY